MGVFTKLRQILVVSAFLSGAALALAADKDVRQFPPVLQSERDVSSYIMYLHEALPEAFRADQWYVDPTKAVQNEQEFIRWLEKPENKAKYEAELPDRPPFQKIHAQIEAPEQVTRPVLSEEGRDRLRRHFEELQKKLGSDEQIERELVANVRALKGQSTQGLMTGMIQCLDNEAKATAFKLPLEQKWDYLLKHITDEQLRAKFRSTVYKPEEISVAFLTQEWGKIKAAEDGIAELALFRQWKKRGATPEALSELAAWKPGMEEDFLKPEAFPSVPDAKEFSKIRDSVKTLVPAQVRPLTQEISTTEWRPQERFTIEEVSPRLGLFRGCLNGDCFTTYAYGFAYSPAERTFLVRDADGSVLMSVYATQVVVDGKKSLYVHDLGNSNVSPEYGPRVFKALHDAKDKLGLEQVVMGEKGMHHSRFQMKIRESAQETPALDIIYQDGSTRELIGQELVRATGNEYSRGHDLPKSHAKGRVYLPKEDTTARVMTSVTPFAELSPAQVTVSKEKKRNLLLDFLAHDQDDLAKSIFASMDNPSDVSLTELKTALKNSAGLPLEEYHAHLQKTLTAAGLEWDQNAIKQNSNLLAEGHLRAPDAWQGPDSPVSKQTLEYLTQRLRPDPSDAPAAGLLKKHPEIAETPAFEKLFRALLKDNDISLRKAVALAQYYDEREKLAGASPALVDALYDVVRFENGRMALGTIFNLLQKIPHEPTPEQLKKLHTPNYNWLGLLTGQDKVSSPLARKFVKEAMETPEGRKHVARVLLTEPEWYESPEGNKLFERILADGGNDHILVEALSRQDATQPKTAARISLMMKRAESDPAIASSLLMSANGMKNADRLQLLHRILVRGKADPQVAQLLSNNLGWLARDPGRWAVLNRLLASGNSDAEIARVMFGKPWSQEVKSLDVVRKLVARGKIDLPTQINLLKIPEYSKIPEAERVIEQALAKNEPALNQAVGELIWTEGFVSKPQFIKWYGTLVERAEASPNFALFAGLDSEAFVKGHPDEAYTLFRRLLTTNPQYYQISNRVVRPAWARHPNGLELALAILDHPQFAGIAQNVLSSPEWIKHPKLEVLLKKAMESPAGRNGLAAALTSPAWISHPRKEALIEKLLALKDPSIDSILALGKFGFTERHPLQTKWMREVLGRAPASDLAIAQALRNLVDLRLAEELVGKLIAMKRADVDRELLYGILQRPDWLKSHRGSQFVDRIIQNHDATFGFSNLFYNIADDHPRKWDWIQRILAKDGADVDLERVLGMLKMSTHYKKLQALCNGGAVTLDCVRAKLKTPALPGGAAQCPEAFQEILQ